MILITGLSSNFPPSGFRLLKKRLPLCSATLVRPRGFGLCTKTPRPHLGWGIIWKRFSGSGGVFFLLFYLKKKSKSLSGLKSFGFAKVLINRRKRGTHEKRSNALRARFFVKAHKVSIPLLCYIMFTCIG